MEKERTGEGWRFCKRCLVEETGEEELFRTIQGYIARMDAELRVSEEEYGRRLAECRSCDNLLSGMCRVCGCYVELRAAAKRNGCPAVRPRW